MSAKVSYGELRDRACDALNAASSVMKNAKTSSTQIAYNVSLITILHAIIHHKNQNTPNTSYFYNKGSLTANSTKKGKNWDEIEMTKKM